VGARISQMIHPSRALTSLHSQLACTNCATARLRRSANPVLPLFFRETLRRGSLPCKNTAFRRTHMFLTTPRASTIVHSGTMVPSNVEKFMDPSGSLCIYLFMLLWITFSFFCGCMVSAWRPDVDAGLLFPTMHEAMNALHG